MRSQPHFPHLGVILLTAFLFAGCAGSDPPLQEMENDGTTANQTDHETPTNQENQQDPDPIEASDEKQRTFSFSAGGGDGFSQNYGARIILGAPTPIGVGQSSQFRAHVGVGPAQHGQIGPSIQE